MTAAKEFKRRANAAKNNGASLESFPDYKAAKQAQIERLGKAREALLKDESYRRIRDWFLSSTMFAKMKEDVAQWCEAELGNPKKLPSKIADHVINSGLLKNGLPDVLALVRPHILKDDVVQFAGDTIASFAEEKLNDDKLYYTICAEIEKKAGSLGWLAHLVGAMDTRVLTHDVADAIADYAKSLRGSKKNEVRTMLSSILDSMEDFDFESHLSKKTVKTVISQGIAHIGRGMSAKIRQKKVQTLPTWADTLMHKAYSKVVNIVFQRLTASLDGNTERSEEGDLTALIVSIIREPD